MTYKIKLDNIAVVYEHGRYKEMRILTTGGEGQFFFAHGYWNKMFNTGLEPTPITEVQDTRKDQLQVGDVVLCSQMPLDDFAENLYDDFYMELAIWDGYNFLTYSENEDMILLAQPEYIYVPIYEL